ncbi:MAG TPA: gamma-glutamyltransferase, partial [Ignavibacteriaceae bacterium]
YSAYDSYGNAVSTTTTINSSFGCGIVVEGAGFLLNNEMDDFSGKPGVMNQFGLLGTEANSIQPEKRMLSSMTPTIILKDGEPFIIIGSPGVHRLLQLCCR